MGEIVRIACERCGLDRDVFDGVGMAGLGETLCACYRCERLVMKKWSVHDDPAKQDNFTCPYCKHPIEPMLGDGRTHDCPTCDRQLVVESIGVWD